MAEINLLQNQETESKQRLTTNILNNIGIGLLVLVLAFYGTFYFLDKNVNAKMEANKAHQIEVQQQIKNDKEYPSLIRHQEKVSNLKILLDQHLSWGDLIQKFGDATLKTATYTKFLANAQGGATVTGIVPDFANLDKLMKAYQLNQFNYIKDVQLVNIALSDKDQNGIQFTLKLNFNKDMLLNIGK
jgi:hypothetical protein